MCDRFAQAQTREEYLAYLADEAEREAPHLLVNNLCFAILKVNVLYQTLVVSILKTDKISIYNVIDYSLIENCSLRQFKIA